MKLVNKLIKDLMKFLKENDEQPFFKHVSVLSSGSYYEYVKVNIFLFTVSHVQHDFCLKCK